MGRLRLVAERTLTVGGEAVDTDRTKLIAFHVASFALEAAMP